MKRLGGPVTAEATVDAEDEHAGKHGGPRKQEPVANASEDAEQQSAHEVLASWLRVPASKGAALWKAGEAWASAASGGATVSRTRTVQTGVWYRRFEVLAISPSRRLSTRRPFLLSAACESKQPWPEISSVSGRNLVRTEALDSRLEGPIPPPAQPRI
jgi:hypothetical protein